MIRYRYGYSIQRWIYIYMDVWICVYTILNVNIDMWHVIIHNM